MEQEFTKVIEVSNTPIGWASLSEQIDTATTITARTTIKGDLDDQQLFCLRYCFIELDRLEENNLVRYPFALEIKVERVEDAFRIQHYLAIMTALRKIDLKIICGNQIIRGRKKLDLDFYRILPMICVGVKDNKWMSHYFSMVNPGDYQTVQLSILQSFEKKPSFENNSHSTDLLSWLCLQNFWCLQRELAGPEDEAMSRQEKEDLLNELLPHLLEEAPRLGLLARLLWSLFLRSLSESKDLFYRDSNKSWHIDMETLRCTRLDAVSYAEGILQLIENACVHSEKKRSYVSIRISDVNIMSRGPLSVAKAAQKRLEIYHRHNQFWEGAASNEQDRELKKAKPSPEYRLDGQIKFCLEFSVLNDAFSNFGRPNEELWGIIRTYARNRGEENWEKMTLDQVFSYRCKRMADIAKHYGLRLLEKTVQLNGGYLTVSSPSVPGIQTRYCSFYRTEVKKSYYEIESRDTCTEFCVLLPIFPHWNDTHEEPEISAPPESLFQEGALDKEKFNSVILCLQAQALEKGQVPFFLKTDKLQVPELLPIQWDDNANENQRNGFKHKEAIIDDMWRELNSYLEGHNALLLLDLMSIKDVVSLELIAKSIFYLIAWQHSKRKSVLLALLLPDEMFTCEFVRVFSIFYDKQLSAAQWMGESQIALCGYQEENGTKLPHVYFLLAGKDSGSARITARTFAYYNTGSSLELLPQIRYLTRTENGIAEPQFPFDLFLTASPKSEDTGRSWFLKKMGYALEQDLWRHSHGCRLKGIRVRLNSNIYLSSFYEAELLFHNVGIIYRFAFLIVQDLLKQHSLDDKEHLVVVGYEFYSSVLIEQIAQLLSIKGKKTDYLIYADSQEDERIHFSPQLKNMESDSRDEMLNQADFVVILPIGTTMSTIYRITGEIQSRWKGSRFPFDNYVLILVKEEDGNLSSRYWSLDGVNRVILMRKIKDGSETCCRYLLSPQTQWSEMVSTPPNGGEDESVLVYVDKTSTRPKEIFVLENASFRGVSHFLTDPLENDRRLSLLKGLIYYGHIAEGNNHFQFYLDMERYFSRAQQKAKGERRKTVDEWLQGLRSEIDPNAYNIIVSPLHKEDSPFAKAAIDKVFEHSLRFLHMDLEDTYREDARAKFSYIADEYRRIKQFDRNKPVNIYFVNTAITSGSTLVRARNLAIMLMEESGVSYDRESVFKGCFVLINRSAYDTLNSYVRFPEKHFWAYLQLAVPSFNSRQDRCPTCDLIKQYSKLEYSSATNDLGREFHRLQVKHKKRTLKEYQSWLANAVMYGAGYAGWLRQWLYNYVREKKAISAGCQVGIFTVAEVEYKNLLGLYHLLRWGVDQFLMEKTKNEGRCKVEGEIFLNTIQEFTLCDLKRLVESKGPHDKELLDIVNNRKVCLSPEYWKHVLIDLVCAQKNYIRMVATHRAFLKMDTSVKQLATGISERGHQTAGILAELIKESLDEVETLPLKAEWLISYLKVLSRPHLAQYHHIRQGILTIMLNLTAYGIGSMEELPEYLAFAKPFLRAGSNTADEMIRSQVLQTLLKRLAGLQSTYFLRRGNMKCVVEYFDCLRQSFLQKKADGVYQRFNTVPTSIQVEQNMVKLVKWTSSYGDDENGCYLIEESFRVPEEGRENDR